MQITATDVAYTYMKDTPFEKKALHNFNIRLKNHTYTAIIGQTGSGKSTFVQLLNGLLKPTEGEVTIGDWKIYKDTKEKELYFIRKRVGMVFQFPEHQLFDETVLKDVMYGPINFGKSKKEAEEISKEMLTLVGIEPDLYERSPFELSGGQMRRVAIAGVLAIEPSVLILDEPTAGLDPQGHEGIMNILFQWYKGSDERSIILVTHQMEDASRYAEHIIVMDKGELAMEGTPEEVFAQQKELEALGLGIPETVKLLKLLKEKSGDKKINTVKFTLGDTVEEILSFLGKD
ncbi:energy-coupling factor transport system ATP-binding protein [Evansella vedderi]|uniref:Energy-coupling factor transporter ATP-binding protein EcfA2 n=1 Tax=Evansella vedderi TaxID=38282 RepID=A0ABT9ZXR3_9BACI|nr:energy-coupling factor transporter ATPase [Evansella vedderi]MDQ0256035.1 energy-coupling factor transport system ATP-binding protein [Evansella vedderi]